MADLGAIAYDVTEDVGRLQLLTVLVAPVTKTKTVSGIIYDDTGAVCARTVRAYRRSDGMLIDSTTSSASTGAYSLSCTTDEVDRVVQDDDAGTLYNDLIDRVIPGP